MTVENPGQDAQVLEGVIESFTMEDWTYRTLYGQVHSRSCQDWFAQRTIQVTFEPGRRQELRLRVDVPRGTSGVYWCMLRLTPRSALAQSRSLVNYEIPVVIVVGQNPKPVLGIQSPVLASTVARDGKRTFVAALPVINQSEGFTSIGASGQLRNADTGRVVADFRLEDRNMMPGTRRRLNFLAPNLTDGRYRLTFRAVMGTKTLPEVASDYVVQRGVAKIQSEATTMALAPISIQPSSISGSIAPGGSRTVVLQVTNNSKRNLTLEVVPRTVQQSLTGSIGLGSKDLAGALKVEALADERPLSPGERRPVRLRISADPKASGDQWFAVAFQEKGNGLSLAEAIFANYSVIGRSTPSIALESARLFSDGKTPVAVKFLVRNNGNVALKPEPSSSVLEGGVRLVERPLVPTVGDGGLLPGAVVENTVMLPQNLKPGQYVLDISYQYGDRDFARVRVPFTVAAKPKTVKKK